MDVDPDEVRPVITRLRRAQGQIGGVIAMLEDGRDCTQIVNQMAAAGKAVDRAGFALIARVMRCCATDPEEDCSEEMAAVEKLFLTLA